MAARRGKGRMGKERCEHITEKADNFAAKANKRSGESNLNAKKKPNVTAQICRRKSLQGAHIFHHTHTHMEAT